MEYEYGSSIANQPICGTQLTQIHLPTLRHGTRRVVNGHTLFFRKTHDWYCMCVCV